LGKNLGIIKKCRKELTFLAFQVPVGDRAGSNPVIRTKQEIILVCVILAR
jgi:hypothetical protein